MLKCKLIKIAFRFSFFSFFFGLVAYISTMNFFFFSIRESCVSSGSLIRNAKKKTFDEQVFVNGKFREKNVKAKIVNFYLNEERSVEGRWMEKKESNLPKHKILFRKL